MTNVKSLAALGNKITRIGAGLAAAITLALLTPAALHAGGSIFEAGTIGSVNGTAGSGFTGVNFQQTYDVTPLVFLVPTNEGGDPASIRIRDVTTSGFEAVVVEPSGEDGPHANMTNVGYFAIVPGRYEVPISGGGNAVLEAGSVDTTTTIGGAGLGGGHDAVSFSSAFGATPALQTFIQSLNNETAGALPDSPSSPWIVTSVGTGSLNTTGFSVSLERAEVTVGAVGVAETIGFVALTTGHDSFDSTGTADFTISGGGTAEYDSVNSADNLVGWDNNAPDGSGVTAPFSSAFGAAPDIVIASQNRRDGADGGWIRSGAITATGVNLTVDEDQFTDAERGHTSESASIFAFANSFTAATATNDDVHFDDGSTDTTGAVDGSVGDNLWSNNINWRVNSTPGTQNTVPNNVLPGLTDRVNISLNDPENLDQPARISNGNAFEVSTVRIGGNFGLGTGGDGILIVEDGGSLTVSGTGLGSGDIELGTDPRDGELRITTGGQVTTLNGGLLRIGVSGTGGNDLSEVSLNGATSVLTVDGQTQVATGGRGQLIVNDGIANLNGGLRIGGLPNAASNHRGLVDQNGGDVTVTGDLVFGGAANREGGTYNLNGGTLTVTGDIVETAANVDSAQLHLNGGTLLMPNGTTTSSILVQRFSVAEATGTNVAYTANAPITTTGTLAVGGFGTAIGDMTIDDGTFTVNAANAVLGQGNTANGTLTVEGTGVFNVTNGDFHIAGDNTGGADVGTTGAFILGSGGDAPTASVSGGNTEVGTGGTGTFTLNSGTFTQLTNNFVIAQDAASIGTATINGGMLDINNDLNMNAGDSELNVAGGTVNVGADGSGNLNVANSTGSTGDVNITSGTLDIDDNFRIGGDDDGGNQGGLGTVVQDGGTVNAGRVDVANENGSTGSSYTINGGTLTVANQMEIGHRDVGTFTQTGGDVDINGGNFVVGQNDAGAEGTANISGGTLDVANDFNVGNRVGTVNQSGGNVTTNRLQLAANNGSVTAEYNLTGDGAGIELLVNDDMFIGQVAGIGTFNQSAGQVVVNDIINIGGGVNATGIYNITGGSLDAANDALRVGENGTGTLFIDGGDVSAGAAGTANIVIGRNNVNATGLIDIDSGTLLSRNNLQVGQTGDGTFDQSGGATTVNADFNMGGGAGSGRGISNLSGGTIDVLGVTNVGLQGGTLALPQQLNVSGGTLNTPDLIVGVNAGTFGELNQTGGTINVTNPTTLIVGDAGTGTVNHSAGVDNVAGNLILGNQGTGDGTYNLSGTGELNVGLDATIANAGTGTFNQTGGVHTVQQNMDVGVFAGTGAYNLTGGILDFNDTNTSQSNVPAQGAGPPAESVLTIGANGSFTLDASGNLRDVRHIDPTAAPGGPTFTQLGGTLTVGSDVIAEDPAFVGGALPTSGDVAALGTERFVTVIGNANDDWTETGIANFVTGGGSSPATVELDIFGPGAISVGEGIVNTPNGTTNPFTLVTDSDLLVVEGVIDASAGLTIEANWLFDPFENPLEFYDVLYATEGFTDDSVFNLAGDATLFRILDDGNGGQFLQVAAPEPATIAIWTLIGAALFGGYIRRRRRK